MKAWYLLLYHILNFLAINFFNIPAAPALPRSRGSRAGQGRAGHSLRLPKFKAADIRTSGHPDIRTSGHPDIRKKKIHLLKIRR